MEQSILDIRFKTLISNLKEGILVENQDRQILYINDQFCHIFSINQSPESLIGSNCDVLASISCMKFINPEKFVTRIQSILTNKEIVIGDPLQTIDGKYYERDYVPVLLDDVYLGHMWKYRDITIHQNNIKELYDLNNFKNKVFTIISHDLKNPLYALRQLLELFNTENITIDDLKKCIPELYNATITATHMLDNLLIWATSNLYGYNIFKQNLYIKLIVDDILESFKTVATHKKISLVNDIPLDLTMKLDKNIIIIVIRNIISNSLKFTGENGSVTVYTEPYKIIIKDTGIGISQDKIKNLFNIQHSSIGTDGETGHGIGLKICYDLINIHNGVVNVSSEINKGTTFSLIFT